jgi:CheY-like chemotaxis protein
MHAVRGKNLTTRPCTPRQECPIDSVCTVWQLKRYHNPLSGRKRERAIRKFTKRRSLLQILIVEDEPLTAFALKNELERLGHAVIGPATDPVEALQLAVQYRPDVALIEIELGGRFVGSDLARQLSARHIPCIYATAQSTLARSNAGWAIGYLAKPYNPAKMADVIQAIEDYVIGARPAELAMPPSLEFFNPQP